jgi:anti-anti-sigma regulatory factor
MEYRHISVNIVDGVFVVRFTDLARDVISDDLIQGIGNELQGLVGQTETCSLVLDFENIEFIPFAAFEGRLVVLQRKVTQRNGTFRLCNLPASVIQHFKLNGLTEYFSLCNSLEDALAASSNWNAFHSDNPGDDS